MLNKNYYLTITEKAYFKHEQNRTKSNLKTHKKTIKMELKTE